jgi:DNA-binding NarL/FixJ family response regulator
MSGHGTDRMLRVGMIEEASLIGLGMKAVVDADPLMIWAGRRDTVSAVIGLCRASALDVIVLGSWSDRRWTACQMLTEMFRDLVVVVLVDETAASLATITQARLNGARGVIAADADIRRIPVGIRAAVTNGGYVDPQLEVASMAAPTLGDTPLKPLSKREFEVLQLIAEGRTAGSIGSKLGITADTVRTHVGHILRKLSARDRAHAVARAFEISLLRPAAVCGLSDGQSRSHRS